MNFQMFKLDLIKAEEPEIKLLTSVAREFKKEKKKYIYIYIYIYIYVYICICFYYIDYTKTFDCVDHNKLWKILQEMGIPGHLTCLLRDLYSGQEATV